MIMISNLLSNLLENRLIGCAGVDEESIFRFFVLKEYQVCQLIDLIIIRGKE